MTPASIRIRVFRSKGFQNKKMKIASNLSSSDMPLVLSASEGWSEVKNGGLGFTAGKPCQIESTRVNGNRSLHFNHWKVRPACSVMFSWLWLNAHSVAKVIYGARRMHWPLSRFTPLHVPWQHMHVTPLDLQICDEHRAILKVWS